MTAVTLVNAPKAHAAAKAEQQLADPGTGVRFRRHQADAKRFSAILEDRMTRTRIPAEYPNLAWKATSPGRHFARHIEGKTA